MPFDEKPTYSSHINSKPIYSVPVNKVLSASTHDELHPPGDNFFSRAVHHYNRIKRGFFDNLFGEPESTSENSNDSSSTSSLPATAANGETYSSPQKSDTMAPSKP